MGKNETNREKGNKVGSVSQKERFGEILFPYQAVPDYREFLTSTGSNKFREPSPDNN